jgi:hypothetical protein
MTRQSPKFGWLRAALTSRGTCLQGDRDRGSVTAYLLIMTVALVMLAGLVLDGGASLAAQGRAADSAEEAARAGADALEEQSLRATRPTAILAIVGITQVGGTATATAIPLHGTTTGAP